MGAAFARIREWLADRMWGHCPVTQSKHDWRTTRDLGYGQELVCIACETKGWLDYGR